jgi:hypothetical protein
LHSPFALYSAAKLGKLRPGSIGSGRLKMNPMGLFLLKYGFSRWIMGLQDAGRRPGFDFFGLRRAGNV